MIFPPYMSYNTLPVTSYQVAYATACDYWKDHYTQKSIAKDAPDLDTLMVVCVEKSEVLSQNVKVVQIREKQHAKQQQQIHARIRQGTCL